MRVARRRVVVAKTGEGRPMLWWLLGAFLCVILYVAKVRGTPPASPQLRSEKSGQHPYDGYTLDIVGESNYQKALEQICGGRCEDGAEHATHATLVLEDENPHD